MKKTLIFGAILFLHSSLSARWSAIEHIDERDSLWIHGTVSKERSLTVDLFQNKHAAYVRESVAKGGPLSWQYGRKDGAILYDSWVDSTIYTVADQMAFPPHSKPVITSDAQGRVHYAWSYIGPGAVGEVYYQIRSAAGVWLGSAIQISGASENRPGNLAIAVNSNGNRRIVAYTCFEAGIRHLKVSITTDNGTSWDMATDIGSNIGEDFPSVAVDRDGYFYVLCQQGGLKCQMLDNSSPYSKLWEYSMGGVHGQCHADHVDGTISFANLHSGDLIYRYRVNGDIDSSTSHWYGMDTLLTGSTSELASISCYDSAVGIISGLELDKDSLYFEQKGYSGTWDTTRLLTFGDQIYVGKCVDIDSGGYAHIVGNTAVSGPSIIKKDSLFYFTNRARTGIVIIPDTLVIPDTGGTTNPGVPISYMHEVINRGNIVDTFGLYIASTKIDSIAALIRPTTSDTAFYPDTLFIYDTWPGDTDTVYLLIVPSDTCWPCFVDTTKFIGYSWYEPTVRDSAVDTTRIMVDVVLLKEAISPPAGDTVSPLDTITYRIVIQNPWGVHIDSLTIYDLMHPDFDTVWVETTTATSDTHYFTLPAMDTLVWTVRDLDASNLADTLILKGIVRGFDCADIFPRQILNLAYTEGTPCIRGDTTDIVAHTVVIGPVELTLSKTGTPADSDTVYPGDMVTYYIECRNDDPFPAKDVVIRDFLDDDVETVIYASDSPVITATYVEWNVACILAASAYHCTLQVRVGSEYKAVYERFDTLYNWAAAWGDPGWVPDTTYSDTTIHFIKRKLDVYFGKTADPPSRSVVGRGDSIFYALTFYNDTSANSIMRNVEIRDTLDPNIFKADHITSNNGGFSYTHPEIFWTVDSLAPGDTFVGTYYGFVDSSAAFGDSALNWYRVNYPGVFDSTSDTTVHYIGKEWIEKRADPLSGSWVAPGDTIHYSLMYYNFRVDTARSVAITDTVDTLHLDVLDISPPDSSFSGNLLTWNIGDVPPYDSFEVWFDAQIKITAPLGDTIPNTGVFNAADTGSDSTEHYIGTYVPELGKISIPDSGAIVNPGDTIQYELHCHNGGNRLGIDVVVIDTVTNVQSAWTTGVSRGSTVWANTGAIWELTWTIDTFMVDSSEWVTYEAEVVDAVGDSVLNFAISRRDSSNKTIHYIEEPLLWMDKDAQIPYPDSSVVSPGDTIRYYINLENRGADTAHQVIVWDHIDTSFIDAAINISPPESLYTGDYIVWSLHDLPPGYSTLLTYDGVIKSPVSEGTIVNACWGSGVDADTAGDTTYHFIRQQRTEKWANPPAGTTVRPGETLRFWLRYSSGNRDTVITIIDTLSPYLDAPPVAISPGGTWDGTAITWIDTVSPSSSDTVWFVATVSLSAPLGDTVWNYGAFESDAGTFVGGPTWHPIGLPDVKLEKTADPVSGSFVTAGDTISYTLRYDNLDGTDTARQIVVYDTLSQYFVSPGIVIWDVGDVPPGAGRDTTFLRAIMLSLPDTAWGDTIFNIAILLSSSDLAVDTTRDTTYHVLTRTGLNMVKRSYKLSGFLLPESSCVFADSSFYYDITVSNTGNVPARELTILDTIRNNYDCVNIDSIITGPDSVWWHGNNVLVPPNVIGWWIPEIGVGASEHMRFRVHVIDSIALKNEVMDTFDVLKNTCWIEGRNVELDSSDTHILFVGFKAGVEIEPDTAIDMILGQTQVCNLRVKNTGSFTDSISLTAKNLAPGWQIFLGGTTDSSYMLPDVPKDTIRFLPVTLVAPNDTSSNTALVIATSRVSERRGKTVKDTAVITIRSGWRIVNIIVEPDTSASTSSGNTREYRYMRVINRGNDTDVVDMSVDTLQNGWSCILTHEDGTPFTDTDGDAKPDIGTILPNGTTRLLLRVTPPPDVTWGLSASHVDTLVIWGTSSHDDPQDSIVALQDSAAVITRLSLDEGDIHNYPNPFRKDEGTTFVFVLPKKAKCTLIVYTRKGEVINVVFDGKIFEPGRHDWPWNATNKSGNKIAAETYVYTFKVGSETIVKKLVVLPALR